MKEVRVAEIKIAILTNSYDMKNKYSTITAITLVPFKAYSPEKGVIPIYIHLFKDKTPNQKAYRSHEHTFVQETMTQHSSLAVAI